MAEFEVPIPTLHKIKTTLAKRIDTWCIECRTLMPESKSSLGYLAWHGQAERRGTDGQEQELCELCKRWKWTTKEHYPVTLNELIAALEKIRDKEDAGEAVIRVHGGRFSDANICEPVDAVYLSAGHCCPKKLILNIGGDYFPLED